MCCVSTRRRSAPKSVCYTPAPHHITREGLPSSATQSHHLPCQRQHWETMPNCIEQWCIKRNPYRETGAQGSQNPSPAPPQPPATSCLPSDTLYFLPRTVGYSQGRRLHVAHIAAALWACGADALEASTSVDARGPPGTQVLRTHTLINI